MSSFFGGKKGGIEQVSKLSKEQQALMGKLAPYLQERIGQGLPAWTGEWVAPMTGAEETSMGRLADYLGQTGMPDIYGTARGALSSLIQQGMTPQATYDWYMQYMAPEERRVMEEEIIPGIKESMVAPGTLYGTPYTGAVEDAWSKFGSQQMSRIGQAVQQAQGLAAGLIPTAKEFAGYESELPLRQAAAGQQYGALPRLLQQQELAARIAEFVRTTPELSPILNLAMQLLGIPTTETMYRQ